MSDFAADLTNRIALVTNAGTEVGRAIALALAGAGAVVGVHDVNPNRADHVVEAIQAAGGRALPWVGDISNRFQVAAMIEALRDEFGGLQVLVNVVGTNKQAAFLTMDEYDWRRMLELNLTGAFFCTQLAGRVMVEEGGGVVVSVISAEQAPSAAYQASQAGLVGLTQAAAAELAGHNVGVHVIRVGNLTPKANIMDSTTQDRAASLDAAASAVLVLCAAGSALASGQVITV